MTPDLLRRVGEALYGEHWQAPLAVDLNVAVRTVQRWATGERPMPQNLPAELAGVIGDRREALGTLYWEITVGR